MIYRFGLCEIDIERLELRVDGALQAIEPQVFSLLKHLIENRDKVVSKDEMIAAVWNGRIVSDATLSSRINAARKAVGDTGRSQSVIRTYARRGFRFVADLETDPSTDDADNASTNNQIPPLARGTGKASGGRPVVAVLPFTNMSSDADDVYFSDGLTEDIITELARFRDLRIISRNSTFQYNPQNTSMDLVGSELGAGFIVEGSVRRSKDRLRVSAQLVECDAGTHLWAERYDRSIEDIFEVQDELTSMIAATLGARLHEVGRERSLTKHTADLGAYDCVLRARPFLDGPGEAAHGEARDLLERAVELDNSYADAYALLANVYLAEYRFEFNALPNPVERAMAMAQKSIEIDPQNATAHCWLAIVYFFCKENELFVVEARRALALNPNDAEMLANIGHYFAFMGEFDRGCELLEQAIALNPLHASWYHFSFARRAYSIRDYKAALAYSGLIALPDFYWSWMLRIAILGQLGEKSEAAIAAARLYEIRPDFDMRAEVSKWNTAADDATHLVEGWEKAGILVVKNKA